MKQELLKDVIQGMLPYLNNAQSEKLQEVLQDTLVNYEVVEKQQQEGNLEQDFVELFRTVPDVDAGLAASVFHFGEIEIPQLKNELQKNGIHVRV